MDNNRQDELFEELAKAYQQAVGEALQREAESLAPQPDLSVARMDRRVQQATGKKRRRSLTRTAGLLAGLAAVVAVAVLLWPATQRRDYFMAPEDGHSTAGSMEADTPADGQGPEDAQILPIGFSLPEGYVVVDSELDNGLSVYTLENQREETLVVTLDPENSVGQYAHLNRFTVDGTAVYAAATPDYSLLALQKGGVCYTISWQYELGPLVDLAHAIV